MKMEESESKCKIQMTLVCMYVCMYVGMYVYISANQLYFIVLIL